MEFATTCPVCKSQKNKVVVNEYSYIQAARHFCPESRNVERNQRLRNVIKDLWKQDTAYFLRCEECGFGFGYPFVGGNEVFYNILHEQLGYPVNRWEYEITIQKYFREVPPQKILDIGAGNGFFLEKVTSAKRYALEGSDATRSILKEKGILVYDNPERLLAENEAAFDYITMYQVLEHISEFDHVFHNASKLLNEGGYFIISVPDCDAMIAQEKLTGCPDMVPNHINKWTPFSLQKALKNYGFEVQDTVYEPSSAKKFLSSVYLKMLHLAAKDHSLVNKIYTIKNKSLRIMLLASYSPIVIPQLLRNYKKLNGGGSFLVKAVKTNNYASACS